MKSLVRNTVLIMLILIGMELVAPLMAEACVDNHSSVETSIAPVDSISAESQTSAPCHDLGCEDSCGLPLHTHMSQFPPTAFHDCSKRAPAPIHTLQAVSAPATSHVQILIRPPILV